MPEEDEINVPMALSVFRDGINHALSAEKLNLGGGGRGEGGGREGKTMTVDYRLTEARDSRRDRGRQRQRKSRSGF